MVSSIRCVGVLTGGGDSSGTNAAIRGTVRRAEAIGMSVKGIRRGWAGLVEGDIVDLTEASTRGITDQGGTILGTSRTNPFMSSGDTVALEQQLRASGIDGIIAMGGDDTLGVAERVSRELAVPIVGIAQSIDNDIAETDYSIGFDTAVSRVAEAVRSVRTTCQSHGQGIVVEVMGRDTGWIAAASSIATEADYCLVPEVELDVRALAASLLRRNASALPPIIIASEGVGQGAASRLEERMDSFGNPYLSGAGYWLRDRLQEATGLTIRCLIVGYIQRGGPPTSHEIQMAVRLGCGGVEFISGGLTGCLVAMQGSALVPVDLSRVHGRKRYLPSAQLGFIDSMAHGPVVAGPASR